MNSKGQGIGYAQLVLACPVKKCQQNGQAGRTLEYVIETGMIMTAKLTSKIGITLMELMIVVVIVSIVSLMAVPKFQAAWERIRIRSINRDIVSTLRLARSKSITSKEPYGVFFDGNALTVTLFKDLVNPGSVVFDPGDSVLRVDTLSIEFTYLGTDLQNDALVFQPNGTVDFVGTGNIVTLASTEDLVGITHHNILASTGRVRTEASYY